MTKRTVANELGIELQIETDDAAAKIREIQEAADDAADAVERLQNKIDALGSGKKEADSEWVPDIPTPPPDHPPFGDIRWHEVPPERGFADTHSGVPEGRTSTSDDYFDYYSKMSWLYDE